MAEIKACIETIKTKLMPRLKTLSPEDRNENVENGGEDLQLYSKK